MKLSIQRPEAAGVIILSIRQSKTGFFEVFVKWQSLFKLLHRKSSLLTHSSWSQFFGFGFTRVRGSKALSSADLHWFKTWKAKNSLRFVTCPGMM